MNYTPLAKPVRILDTRSGVGLSGPFATHAPRAVQVAGVAGIPANAIAVNGNLTVTQQTSAGFLFIGPQPIDPSLTSSLQIPATGDRDNAVAGVGLYDGKVGITLVNPINGQRAHVILDINGYYTA